MGKFDWCAVIEKQWCNLWKRQNVLSLQRHALLYNNPYNYDCIFFERTNFAKEASIASANPPFPPNASNLQYYNVLLCMIWIFTQSQTKGLVIAIYQKLEKNHA